MVFMMMIKCGNGKLLLLSLSLAHKLFDKKFFIFLSVLYASG